MMHIDVEEIRHVVRKQRAKRKTLLDTFAKLSNDQQQQVTRLLEDLETLDYPKGATWTFTLQALLTQPKGKAGKDIKSIQVFVERRLQPGTTPSRMVSELPNGAPLKYSTTQYPENAHPSSSADPPQEPPPAPPMSYMRPGQPHNSDPRMSTQTQHHSVSTITQPQHSMPSTPGWTGINTATQPQHYMPSASGWADPSTNIQQITNDVSADSRTGEKEEHKQEPRHRSGKEATVRFAPLPHRDQGRKSSTRSSKSRASSHSERRTSDNDSRNSEGSSSPASISDDSQDSSASSTRRKSIPQRSHRNNDEAILEERQVSPTLSFQASDPARMQHQDFAMRKPPQIVESLLSKWTFLDMPQNRPLKVVNHVATKKTSAEDDAKIRAAIDKKVQQRRQGDPISEIPEVEGMD